MPLGWMSDTWPVVDRLAKLSYHSLLRVSGDTAPQERSAKPANVRKMLQVQNLNRKQTLKTKTSYRIKTYHIFVIILQKIVSMTGENELRATKNALNRIISISRYNYYKIVTFSDTQQNPLIQTIFPHIHTHTYPSQLERSRYAWR